MAVTANKPRRKRRIRERPLWQAALWSVAVTMALGLLAFQVAVRWPGTPLHNFWELVVVNGQVSPTNPLISQFLEQVRWQDVLIETLLCLMGGGIALGRLAPRSATRGRVLGAGVGGAALVVVIILALSWTLEARQRGGHLDGGDIDAQLVATQLGWIAVWTLAYLAGALAGLRWRDRQASGLPGDEAEAPGAAAGARGGRKQRPLP